MGGIIEPFSLLSEKETVLMHKNCCLKAWKVSNW